MFRLLIADDQVPDSNLASEQEVLEHYSKRYKDSGFAAGFVFIYKLMKFLKAQNYEVDSANTPSKAIELVKRRTYDVIILDLGWWTIESMAYDDKMILGWRIAKDIQQNSPAQYLCFLIDSTKIKSLQTPQRKWDVCQSTKAMTTPA